MVRERKNLFGYSKFLAGFLFLFTSFCVSIPLDAQQQIWIDSLKQVLVRSDYGEWLNTLEKLQTSETAHLEQALIREITGGYAESMFAVSTMPWKDGKEDESKIRIRILSLGDSISYFRLALAFPEYETLIATQYNRRRVQVLDSFYVRNYARHLSIDDLFVSHVFYGKFCGRAGAPPGERMRIDRMVKYKDIRELEFWLRSPVAEIQIYGYEAAFRIMAAGGFLNDRIQKWMDLIRKKRGDLLVCSGMLEYQRPIREIIQEIERDWGTP